MAATIYTPFADRAKPDRNRAETDMSEAQGLVKLLEFIAEEADGNQWLSLRFTVQSTLFTLGDKLKVVDRFMNT